MPAKGEISNRRKYHNCPQCNAPFFGPQKYCSDECCKKAGKPLPKKNGINKQCEICNAGFYVSLARKDARFCSHDCANKWQSRNKVNVTCKTCLKDFLVSPSRIVNSKTIYCSQQCRNDDPDHTKHLMALNVYQQTLSPNNLEIIAYRIIDSIGVAYSPQFVIAGKFCVDAFVESANLIIQIDGDYWHGNQDIFQTIDKRQQKQVKKDKSQNAYFEKCGYNVLRFWETDIHKRPEWVKQQIESML